MTIDIGCPCTGTYSQTGYSVYCNGLSCTASCALGYTGTVQGSVTCDASSTSGSTYSGSFSGCTAIPTDTPTTKTPTAAPPVYVGCPYAYTQRGYVVSCGTSPANWRCYGSKCADGFLERPGPYGYAECVDGSYYTGTLGGCIEASSSSSSSAFSVGVIAGIAGGGAVACIVVAVVLLKWRQRQSMQQKSDGVVMQSVVVPPSHNASGRASNTIPASLRYNSNPLSAP